MKKLLLIPILLLSILSTVSGQKLIKFSYGNQDKSAGINYIDTDYNFYAGFETGKYTTNSYESKHQKYKIGTSLHQTFEYRGSDNDFIFTAAVCCNIYDTESSIASTEKHDLQTTSVELGIMSNFTEHIYFGFDYDIVHLTGGFSIGFKIF